MTPDDHAPAFFADVTLARRLERAEGRAGAGLAEARAAAFPEPQALLPRWGRSGQDRRELQGQ